MQTKIAEVRKNFCKNGWQNTPYFDIIQGELNRPMYTLFLILYLCLYSTTTWNESQALCPEFFEKWDISEKRTHEKSSTRKARDIFYSLAKLPIKAFWYIIIRREAILWNTFCLLARKALPIKLLSLTMLWKLLVGLLKSKYVTVGAVVNTAPYPQCKKEE